MTGPYRQASPTRENAPADLVRDPEATIIHSLLTLLGGARLAAIWGLHEPFGAEATVALVFAIVGLSGLAAALFRR